ncbi:MAG: hypothetical protein KIT09_06510 [Bryobacteraceae bacterium]|nr:hypothetical protein [Bryobacteraceae bacterium]
MNLLPHLIILAVITLIVAFLALYRNRVTRGEDDTIHVLDGDQRYVADQAKLAQRVAVIDRWGKILTVIAVVYAVALAGLYMYSLFSSNEIRMG